MVVKISANLLLASDSSFLVVRPPPERIPTVVANRQGSAASGATTLVLDPTELFPEIPNLYEFPSVHSDMIYDEHRVRAYQRAIERTVKPGDVIVDLGTGTGLLAFLCARAGASRVHAIEKSPVIDFARRLAVVNGLADRIVFHYGDSRDVELGERADVIVSELIGHIAFEEGMADTLLDAKKRFLKPGGEIIPTEVSLYAAPVCERRVYPSSIDIWKAAYGFDYSVMREQALQTSYVTRIDEADLLAPQQSVLSVSFLEEAPSPASAYLRFRIHRPGQLNGVALWFDALLTEYVPLSSSPWAKTHWQQCFKPIPDPLAVSPGEEVEVSITMTLPTRGRRPFDLRISVTKGSFCASS